MFNAGLMVIVKDCVATPCWPPRPTKLSVICTTKGKVPDAVGVPLIWPFAGLMLKPPGSAPLLIDHEYPGVPPDALKGCVGYRALTSPFGRVAGAMFGAEAILSGTVAVPLCKFESVT